MKTNVLSLQLLGLSLFIYSCELYENDGAPSRDITTMQATYSDYDAIDVSTAFTVYLSFSDTYELIEIEANDNLHQYIEVKKEKGTLVIGLEDHVRIRGNSTLNAYITTKSVSGYAASGASRFIVENPINEENVYVYLSGASSFTGELNSNKLYADLSGASVFNSNGNSNDFKLDASGASVVRDYGLTVKKLNAELSGASNAYLTIDDEIDIEASGASNLHFKGDATVVKQDLSGASTIKRM